MGHINFDKQNSRKRGWKGFYLALAVCLVAVGGVAVATFMRSPGLSQGGASSETPTSPTTTAPSRPVGQVVTNVPDERTTTSAATTTTTAPTATTTAPAADLFVLPLTNEVLEGYSDGQPVYSETMNDWRVHNGVDFAGEAGQTVKALADGTILSVEEDSLWGKIVTIDHGFGIHSRYCGVDVGTLAAGQTVKVNEPIGTLTDIPCELTEGPHLHLEILVNDEYVNPVEAIGRDVKTAAATTTTAK